MRLTRILRILIIYLGLWAFSFLCAISFAEAEIVREYRPLVYTGVAFFLLALGLLVVGFWLFLLYRIQNKLRRLASKKAPLRIERLQALLKKHRSASFRSLISLELVNAYLEAGENEAAYSLLALLRPKASLYFNRKSYLGLLTACACRKNSFELYCKSGCVPIDPADYPFLTEEEVGRLRSWKQQKG